MKSLSNIAKNLSGQRMFQIMDKAKELESKGKTIYHLEIGDPDFDSPPSVIHACKSALDKGNTHYASSYGLEELRSAGANATYLSRGFKPSLDQIVVTAGANIQLYYVIACTVNPGDEVIMTDPSFVSYAAIIKLLGAIPVFVPLLEENGFILDPDDLKSAITNKTRLVITNSPNNPTGSVIPQKIYKEIFDIVDKYDLYLLSDEVYGRMVYEDINIKFSSPSIFDHCKERVIIVHSLSKSFAMTGWRIGAVTAPVELARKIALLLETTSSCVSPFIQYAAISALTDSKEYVNNMVKEYQVRRDFLVSKLNNIDGIHCTKPDGAFYIFANIKKTGLSSIEFCDNLLSQSGVAACPGIYFGNKGEGYARFCFAKPIEYLDDAMSSMENYVVKDGCTS